MAMFDGHLKCARCRDKGEGDEPCILKVCPICKAFTAEQVQKLATPTYRTRKEKEQKKTAGTSKTSTGAVTQPAEVFTGASHVQATRDIATSMTATQPVEAPDTKRESAASMTAAWITHQSWG